MASSVSTAVPPVLVELTKKVLRAFYDPLCTAVVDILIKELCVREDDLAVLLSLDRSFLASGITRLVKDKLLQKKEEIDPTAPLPEEGEREKKHTYYFIDYEMLVNVVRLRIHLIQQSIKKAARQNLTERPKASCTNCAKGFSDLEMDRVIDMATGNFICDLCNGIVEYDDNKVDTNQIEISELEAKFNRQFVPFLELLKQAEHEKIMLAIAAPEPTKRNLRGSQGAVGASDLVFSAKQQITIDFAGTDKVTRLLCKYWWWVPILFLVVLLCDNAVQHLNTRCIHQKMQIREAKAMPILHRGNALGQEVLGGVNPVVSINASGSNSQGPGTTAVPEPRDDSIMNLLTTSASVPTPGLDKNTAAITLDTSVASTIQATSGEGSVGLNAPGEDDDETEMVTVAGVTVPYEDITDENVSNMTENELAYYEELKEILG